MALIIYKVTPEHRLKGFPSVYVFPTKEAGNSTHKKTLTMP